MGVKVQIIKRLESLKTALELDDYDIIDIHLAKLQKESDKFLDKIISMVKKKIPDEEIIEKIDDYIYGYKDSQLTPHQKEIFDGIVKDFDNILSNYNPLCEYKSSDNFISLNGFAGVGKTFVTAKLVKEFLNKGYKILLATPTHKALSVARYMLNAQDIRIKLSTLHSYLDIQLYENDLDGTKSWKKAKDKKQSDYEKDLDILIVDESSMINNELFGFIEENLSQHKLKSVLFIGDKYQLPPITDSKETNMVVSLPKQHTLTQVVRQAKDSYIKQIAIQLKDCIQSKDYKPLIEIFSSQKYPQLKIFEQQKTFLEDFTKNSRWWEEDKIIASYTNQDVDDFNKALRFKFWLDYNNTIPSEAIIKGDRLVFNEAYKKKFKNSEIIEVTEAKKYYHTDMQLSYFVVKDKLGRSFKVIEPNDLNIYNNYLKDIGDKAHKLKKYGLEEKKRRALWRKYFAIKAEYADLKYIYSSTIHKLQGSTYDEAYIDLSPIIGLAVDSEKIDLAYRLAYVAVTRARKNIKVLL
jgi:ATP-dependent exoDNAse (exonuclease V) alpha subunit